MSNKKTRGYQDLLSAVNALETKVTELSKRNDTLEEELKEHEIKCNFIFDQHNVRIDWSKYAILKIQHVGVTECQVERYYLKELKKYSIAGISPSLKTYFQIRGGFANENNILEVLGHIKKISSIKRESDYVKAIDKKMAEIELFTKRKGKLLIENICEWLSFNYRLEGTQVLSFFGDRFDTLPKEYEEDVHHRKEYIERSGKVETDQTIIKFEGKLYK